MQSSHWDSKSGYTGKRVHNGLCLKIYSFCSSRIVFVLDETLPFTVRENCSKYNHAVVQFPPLKMCSLEYKTSFSGKGKTFFKSSFTMEKKVVLGTIFWHAFCEITSCITSLVNALHKQVTGWWCGLLCGNSKQTKNSFYIPNIILLMNHWTLLKCDWCYNWTCG